MNKVFSFVLIALAFSGCTGHKHLYSSTNDPLVGTNWKLIGFVSAYKDSIYRYPEEYNFSIRFEPKFKISGKTFDPYFGKYKYKNVKILINASIGVGYNSKYDVALYGGANKVLDHTRLYVHSLSMSKPVKFTINANELLIYSR